MPEGHFESESQYPRSGLVLNCGFGRLCGLGPATGGSVSFEVEAVAKSAADRSLLPPVTVWLVAAM